MIPIFKNRENTLHTIDGKEIWESRSSGTTGVIFAKHDSDIYVLIEKRSKNMPDLPEKWCLPCGYFDWDENGVESIYREVYQETSFYIPDYNDRLIFNNAEKDDINDIQPFYTKTSPKEIRQNISHHYIFIFDFSSRDLPIVENYKDKEIEIVKWEKIYNILLYKKNEYDWGVFAHDKIIEKAITKFEKYLI